VSDIDTVVVDSLKALDPEWPIREADLVLRRRDGRFVPKRHHVEGGRPPDTSLPMSSPILYAAYTGH
jgi:hypothetical protein